jgi:hypothetical protein
MRACHDQGRVGALRETAGGAREVGQRLLVSAAGERAVEVLVERLEVKLDATACRQRELDCLIRQPWVHAAVGLPADNDAVFGEAAAGGQGVHHLAGRIAAKEAGAVGLPGGTVCQFLC